MREFMTESFQVDKWNENVIIPHPNEVLEIRMHTEFLVLPSSI